jgi:hypothetical protein
MAPNIPIPPAGTTDSYVPDVFLQCPVTGRAGSANLLDVLCLTFSRNAKPYNWDADLTRRTSLDNQFGDFHLAGGKSQGECPNDLWVELTSRALRDHLFGFERRNCFPVRAVACQRVIRIGHRNDAGLERDIGSACGMVPGSIKVVMVRKNDRKY